MSPESDHGAIAQAGSDEALVALTETLLRDEPAAIIVTGLDGRIIQWSQRAGEMFGYSAEEMLGQHTRLLTHPDTRNVVSEKLRAAVETDGTFSGEILCQRKDGSDIWIRLTLATIYDADDRPIARISVNEDMTPRIRQEAAERSHLLRLAALEDTALALTEMLELEPLLERILDNVVRVVEADYVIVRLFISEDEHIVRHRNLYPEKVSRDWKPTLPSQALSFPMVQQLVKTGEPVLVSDTRSSPLWVAESWEWAGSAIDVPVLIGGQVAGFLALFHRAPGFYTEEVVRQAQAFASQVAVAYRNVRLFEEERSQRRFSEALAEIALVLNSTPDQDTVFDRILGLIQQVIPTDYAHISLLENDHSVIVRRRVFADAIDSTWSPVVSLPVANIPVLRKMIDTLTPCLVPDIRSSDEWVTHPDEEWIASYLAAPILHNGEPIGFITLLSSITDFLRRSIRAACWLLLRRRALPSSMCACWRQNGDSVPWRRGYRRRLSR